MILLDYIKRINQSRSCPASLHVELLDDVRIDKSLQNIFTKKIILSKSYHRSCTFF